MNSDVKGERPPQPPESLLSDVVHDNEKMWRRWARTGVIAVFVLVLLAGLTGMFDLGTSSQTKLGGATVDVDHPLTTRAGMDTRLIIVVSADEELPDTIRIEIDQEYLELMEDLLLIPEPTEQLALDNDVMRLEYDVPEGTTRIRFTIEGRASDQWEPWTSGTIRLFSSDGAEAELPISTWRLP